MYCPRAPSKCRCICKTLQTLCLNINETKCMRCGTVNACCERHPAHIVLFITFSLVSRSQSVTHSQSQCLPSNSYAIQQSKIDSSSSQEGNDGEQSSANAESRVVSSRPSKRGNGRMTRCFRGWIARSAERGESGTLGVTWCRCACCSWLGWSVTTGRGSG